MPNMERLIQAMRDYYTRHGIEFEEDYSPDEQPEAAEPQPVDQDDDRADDPGLEPFDAPAPEILVTEETVVTTDDGEKQEARPATPRRLAAAITNDSWAAYQTLANASKMATNAGLDAAQFDEYVKILKEEKTASVALFEATNNDQIQRLDWTIGDGDGDEFSRAFIYGDWVRGGRNKKESRAFLEIQIKRVAGDDQLVLEACGVHPHFSFLGLLDDQSTDSSAVKGKGQAKDPGCATTTTGAPILSGSAAIETANTTTTTDPAPSATSSSVVPSAGLTIHPFFWSGHLTAGQQAANAAARAQLYSIIDGRYPTPAAWAEIKATTSIYLVRVVAMAGPSNLSSRTTNSLTGPSRRAGTLCALGGWVVPRPLPARSSTTTTTGGRLPAAPVEQDWSFAAPVALEGGFVPVWKGEAEPSMRDVYRMVWSLVAGRQFVGLRRGHGFGRRRETTEFYEALEEENPFGPLEEESRVAEE